MDKLLRLSLQDTESAITVQTPVYEMRSLAMASDAQLGALLRALCKSLIRERREAAQQASKQAINPIKENEIK